MKYNVVIEKDGNGYLARFPDIPEAITGGETIDETKELALDALITALDFYFEDQRQVPMPSKAKGEQIQLPVSVWLKVLLLNELLTSSLSQAEIARQVGISRQEMQRVTNLKAQYKNRYALQCI